MAVMAKSPGPGLIYRVEVNDVGESKRKRLRKFLIKAGRIFLAELVGVAMICYALVVYNPTPPGSLPVPIVVGVVFIWVVWVIGPISGAHVNPAVTLAMCMTRRVKIYYGLVYIAGQFVGGIIGSWFGTLTRNTTEIVGITLPADSISTSKALGLEVMATAILVIAVLSVSDEFRASDWSRGHVTMFPFAFGATLTLLAAIFGPLTGGSMNPARSLGPAIVQNLFDRQWIYVVGPCIGAIVAVILYELLLSEGASGARIKAWFTDREFDRKRDYKGEQELAHLSNL